MTQPRNLSIFADGLNSSGVAGVSVGGTGTGTTFTTGSVVFIGASGVHAQNNSNFFWDNTNIRLGIGTASPSDKLQISSGNITLDNNQSLNFKNSSGTVWNAIQVDGSNNLLVGSTNYTGNIQFFNNGAEHMRVDTSGNLLVGTTSTLAGGRINAVGNSNVIASQCGNGNATFLATNTSGTSIYNALVCYNNGTSYSYCGGISVSGSSTSFNTSSDYRLKENVQSMTGGLSAISQLKPVTYDWINTKLAGEGFIAHELQAVIPNAVTGEKDAIDEQGNPVYQGVDYSKIVPRLVAAIQEQQAQIASLSSMVLAQANEIEALKTTK